MFKDIRPALVAMTLLAGTTVAYAQTTQEHDAHHPDAAAPAQPAAPAPGAPQDTTGMGMMGGDMAKMMSTMMRMMPDRTMGASMPDIGPPMARGPMALQHIEGQIAFYKAELRITDAQMAQWNAFADTLRANAKRLQEAYKSAQPGADMASVPDQLTRRGQFLAAQLESLKSTEPAARALYAVLSPEQKKAADELMADHLRRM